MFEFLNNYFNDTSKLFSDLYLVKFLDISARSFFLCTFEVFEAVKKSKIDAKYGECIVQKVFV